MGVREFLLTKDFFRRAPGQPEGMRAVVAAISSRGAPYDALRAAFEAHFRANAPPSLDLVFLYARDGPEDALSARCPHLPRESLVPGALAKTAWFLGQPGLERYDFVVRTNLSSWYNWHALERFLGGLPRGTRLAAGFSPDGSHLSGCNLILSARLARELASAPLDASLIDDLAISRYLFSDPGVDLRGVARLDLVYGDAVEQHGAPEHTFHVRLKHHDRALDVALFRALTACYAAMRHAV